MAIDNEKMFDLLVKIYIEVQGTNSEVKEHTKRLDGLESGQTRLEHTLEDTRKTLFDGYAQNSKDIKRLEAKINDLSDKVKSMI